VLCTVVLGHGCHEWQYCVLDVTECEAATGCRLQVAGIALQIIVKYR
jgi:hypothetical protein